ncbi:MAG: DUF2269 family protein [Dehalococcoidia bacterium]|nr:DUF2269 family protein [Dehalococcoidia bacterium]
MDWWRIIHVLALVWLGAGLGATYPLILRAWASKDLKYQMYCLTEAANNETRILLPGAMATGVTGFFWATAAEYNFVKDGWLFALSAIYIVVYFVCLPLMGFGLRRARLASLIATKKGEETEELREILQDKVPLVFSTVIVLSVPVIAWLAVFKPF